MNFQSLKRMDEPEMEREDIGPDLNSSARSRGAISLPLVSFVIPAHNEERYLGPTLQALRNQTYASYEIIVVANACTDRTAEIARAHCDRLFELEERALGRARNLGAMKARGDLLIFLDADTVLEPKALEIIVRKFSRDDAIGTLKGKPDSQRFIYRVIYFFKNWLHKSALHRGSSGIIICWKEHFKRSHGFDEKLQLRENSQLIKKISQYGHYRYIHAVSVTTSMRRYEKKGTCAIIWHWIKIWVLSLFSDLRHRTYEVIR